jgi:hypothetical protein
MFWGFLFNLLIFIERGQCWEFAIATVCKGIVTKVQKKAEHVGDNWQSVLPRIEQKIQKRIFPKGLFFTEDYIP